MGTQFTFTLPSADNGTITRCNAGSRPDLAADPRTYVMPSNPYAVAAVGAAIMPTVLAVHAPAGTSVMMTPATSIPSAHPPAPANARPTRAVGTTVKKRAAGTPMNAHFRRVGMVSMIIMLGALLGAVLGLAVAPARAHAEGAHAAPAPVRRTAKPIPAPTEAEPSGPAADLPSTPATAKTALAPSPLRAKARSATTPTKGAKRAPSASGLLGAGLGL